MNKCIFCQIVKGNGEIHKVYENKYVLAFMDINPINPGHVLVVPKKHVSDFYKIEDAYYCEVMKTVKNIAKTINKKIKPKKVGLAVAGWDVNHAHIHIIPMQNYHDITSKSIIEGKRPKATEKELEKIARKLRSDLN